MGYLTREDAIRVVYAMRAWEASWPTAPGFDDDLSARKGKTEGD